MLIGLDRDCFVDSIPHKIKVSLRAKYQLPKKEPMLIAVSGGPNSICIVKSVKILPFLHLFIHDFWPKDALYHQKIQKPLR